MSNAARIAVPLLLIVAAGVAAYVLTSGGGEPPPSPAPPASNQRTEPRPQEPPPVVSPAVSPTAPEPDRTAVVENRTAADAPQGVKGRVVTPDGRPAANVPVLLVENFMNDAIRVFLMNRTAKTVPPAASGTTGSDGSFTLGVRQVGKAYDLRIVSPDHPERNLAQLKIREGDWYDAGEIRLEQGLVVQGNVVEEDTKRPIEGVTVWLSSDNQAHVMIATPGRERGIAAVTDARGFFRFSAAPAQGLVSLAAEAEGYASSPLTHLQLKAQGLNEYQIQMVRGEPIGGVVVDPDGKPVAGATITASGLSAKTPQVSTATSGADGTFAFPALRGGPYSLVASMAPLIDARESPVMTGDTNVKLVLGVRPSVKLRVLAQNRSPVKSYRLSLLRYFPNNPTGVGKVMDFADRTVTPADYPAEFNGEWAVIRNVPLGEFRWQIQDNAHAKTLSPPFTVVDGGPPPEVTAELNLGASLTGTVVDERGQPVADALVTTDMNGGPAADIGILDLFKTMMPERHTKAQAKTDAQGRFRIAKLALADYMVRVAHPDYCEGSAIDIKLEAPGQVADVGVIRLTLGAVVEGVTMVGGQPMGQVQVQVSTPVAAQPAQHPGQPAEPRVLGPMFHATVVSDGDGRFRLLKRVPPGRYRITASRMGGENPFLKIVDMKDTEQELVIGVGQNRAEIRFNLVPR